ncbi:F0F1 ATP synthase subunit B [Modestobacter sp. VKM Ac-2979]|uniref:F0F1 ATP synthase subunit B n=1 Tax=unclassified Modestobacter TaxID=2643866 RepID=UPI0022AB5E6E|nr:MULTISPECIES: F0F1 ATP synthase subunit B [unclassified Modestobacter]MCZ2812514.1 F0F1 ATP synthase subunit B [Modestobacter sp. VKM Ac-2979]MCZ2841404.1 F0F1 ATP synthase subunit B [Modestobacter sp. VKM Ac-2980]
MSILAAESANPLLPPFGEIIVGLIAFAVLLFVVVKFVAPRFEQVFQARRAAIEGGIERAEAMQAEAKAALEQYRAQLAEARNEAAQIRDSARAEGQQIIEQLRTQAQEESARIVARGEEQLTASRQQVVAELRGQIGSLAVELAGRVVGESLADDARRSGTVDRFLDELDQMAASNPAGNGAVQPAEGANTGSSVYVPEGKR